jgi:membrane protein DedA with SNARE-associated domain
LRGANCMPAGRFFFLNMIGGMLRMSLRLRCLRSGGEIYKISGTRSVISLGLFIAAGYALEMK